jgi:BolA protein
MSVIDEIIAKLQRELETEEVEIFDFSAQHMGHASLQENATNLHLQGRIKSPKFTGLNQMNRERMVYKILSKEFADGTIHALTLELLN